MTTKILNIQEEAKKIVEKVAFIYQYHTREDFIGLIVHGSVVKGGIIPGSSDIDFHIYLKETAFEKQGILPLELYLKIHRDLSKIDTKPFSYIQCEALTDKLPEGFVGPVPGAYQIVAGRLPVKEASNEQLKQTALQSLNDLTVVPKYFSTLLDHGKERLTRVVRLLNTQVSPTIYHVLSLVHQDAIEVWQMPKNKAIHLLPEEEMKKFAIQFYECAKRYYPDEISVNDALGMIENGAKFFGSVNLWFKLKKTNGEVLKGYIQP
ncbi:nucleotidyltransferase domain-containing protein [Lysinibacillus xylanilyticus]|uniref:nucleotidyltransferase domain-containing protein n=1 Tax=Lysinibacillus xylanilyticus TaxID=582475 RepID=UPI00380B3787